MNDKEKCVRLRWNNIDERRLRVSASWISCVGVSKKFFRSGVPCEYQKVRPGKAGSIWMAVC